MDKLTIGILKMLQNDLEGYSCLEGETLKRFQKCLLSIAKDIIDVCEDEGLVYILGGGTALGAVRHGGFIPWDDDMDIYILGNDYERFRESFSKRYGNKYSLYDVHSHGYYKPIARVCLNNSVYQGYFTEGDAGFSVDIMRIENTPDNKLIRTLHGCMCLGVGFFFSCRRCFFNRDFYFRVLKANPEVKRAILFKLILGAITCVLPIEVWKKITWSCYGLCKNNQSKYVSVPSGRKHYFGRLQQRSGVVNTVRKPFEGHQWRVAKDYKFFLEKLYGADFMTPPSPDKREHHMYCELQFPDET